MPTTNVSTISAGGTQATTGDPQTSVQPSALNGQASTGIQPGSSSSLLTSSSGGISLYSSAIPSTAVGTSASTQSIVATPTAHHVVNPVLFGLAGVLFVAAIILFITTSRIAKNTTY